MTIWRDAAVCGEGYCTWHDVMGRKYSPALLRGEESAKAILRRYAGTLFAPSPATCYSDSAGTVPAVKDGVVGRINCAAGSGLYASQSTAGYKPILRKGAKNWLLNTDFALGTVDGSPGAPPTNWTVGVAPTGVTRTIAHGTDTYGKYLEVRYAGTNTSGSIAYLLVANVYTAAPSALGLTWVGQARVALMAGAWPGTANMTVRELNSSGTFLTESATSLKTLVTGPTPVRVTLSRTTNNASVAYVRLLPVYTPILNNETVDFTFRVYDPMLEVGSSASPYVATTTSPKSNGVDNWWLEFDGVDDRLDVSAVPFQHQDNPFIVHGDMPIMTDMQRLILNLSGATAQFQSYIGATNGYHVSLFKGDDAVSNSVTDNVSGSSLGLRRVVSYVKNGSSKRVRTNGITKTENTAVDGVSTNTACRIGAHTTGWGYWSSPIYALALGKGAISDTELKTVERYLGQLSGVTIV